VTPGLILQISAEVIGAGSHQRKLAIGKKAVDVFQIPPVSKQRVVSQPALGGKVD